MKRRVATKRQCKTSHTDKPDTVAYVSPPLVTPETPLNYLKEIFTRLASIERLLVKTSVTVEVINAREHVKIDDPF